MTQYAGMIRIQHEVAIQGSGGITDIDAGKTPIFQYAVAFAPDLVQGIVHQFECIVSSIAFKGLPGCRILFDKNVVPHGNHGVGR